MVFLSLDQWPYTGALLIKESQNPASFDLPWGMMYCCWPSVACHGFCFHWDSQTWYNWPPLPLRGNVNCISTWESIKTSTLPYWMPLTWCFCDFNASSSSSFCLERLICCLAFFTVKFLLLFVRPVHYLAHCVFMVCSLIIFWTWQDSGGGGMSHWALRTRSSLWSLTPLDN